MWKLDYGCGMIKISSLKAANYNIKDERVVNGMEWVKGKLKDFTIRLEEITNIFVNKMGGTFSRIYFCAKEDDKLSCYRYTSLSKDAKRDIEESTKYFSNNKNKEDLIYKGAVYYVTDKINCYNYLEGDFIVAFSVVLKDYSNELLKEYFDRQIRNYLLYIIPLIYYNKNLYSDYLIESQMSVVTKTLVEEKIGYDNSFTLNKERTRKANYFTLIDQLSMMTYEGEFLNNKCLIFAHDLECDIEICNNVYFSEIKKVRKLLEITYFESEERFLGLLCDTDSKRIKGLRSFDRISNDYTMIIFKDKGKWSIVYKNDELSIIDSKVLFPPNSINRNSFAEILNKEFQNIKVDVIFDLVKQATLQKHGTMIVVSDHAEQEMKRLCSTGYEIRYKKKEESYIEYITAIDGSVLVNSNGEILGIGVILDGESSDECEINNSRGARYNSAIKYTYTRGKKEKCIAVVISEDGDINIIKDGKEISITHERSDENK